MKSITVIYKSKYSFTKQYAEWIAEELNADLHEAASVEPSLLSSYDVVVYGGGLYAGGISGVKLVTENPCKALIVFTVGAADPNTTDYSKILTKNFTSEILSKIKVFHLQGGIDFKRLSFVHKIMMAIAKKFRVEKNPEKQSDEDKLFLETYGENFNFTDKSTIKPIIDFVRSL